LNNITSEWELLIIFGLFWLGFYCMQHLYRCILHFLNRPPSLEWWQTDVIYQIYVKSFYDSNGDGVGDLKGVTEKLDYVEKLGAKSIWLSPFYPSGGKDGGYDVTSFVDIDPVYGSQADFDALVAAVHKRGMHVLLDLVPNHTSDQHEWFKESSRTDSESNKYKDYYVWKVSEDKVNPPNNWKSVFGDSAWTYCETRKAWYLHQFLPQQPDLNLRNPAVRQEIEVSIHLLS
jgi:glycosidase